MKVNRDRIKEQSKRVAEYMKKPKKYQVLWTCPHCGNSHTWWWEDEFEAFDDGVVDMQCDRCDEVTKCRGDGHGYYEPIAESTSVKQWSLEQINATLDELQTSRQNHFSMLVKLSAKDDELDDLNTDLHNYVRQIEDKLSKLNEDKKLAFDSINSLAKRLADLENPPRPEATPKKDPQSFLDLIHGAPPPFHERLREGCQLGDMSGETIARILRFIAVETERMTQRDMGGSFTVSNLKVAETLRELADDAEIADVLEYQPGDTHLDDEGVMRVYTGREWLRVQQNIELELEEDEDE
jgi:hypothetical protein